MALLDNIKERCALMVRQCEADGEGGSIETLTAGVFFSACIAVDSKAEQLTGESAGEGVQYSVLVPRAVTLEHGDIIRRADGSYLRVIAGNADRRAPSMSTLDWSLATAESVVIM